LLFGDTGSGKTEVYMQLAAKALDAGGQILILAPEIHLTPQMEENFRSRFPTCRLCILHSGLADGERAHRWLMALSGQADIVLGTRLAVFTPLPRLKLIVVDEEHDESYKQDEGLPFSARDLAVWRAKHEKAALVCGSATPSLESYENTRSGRYQLLRLDARVHKADIHVALTPEEGTLFHGMSQPFLVALGEALNTGGQALIFINRRGYAPTLVCGQCRWTAFCESCETNMTLHRREGRLLCHRCGAARQMPLRCEGCGNRLTAAGSGTQRIEEALTRRFALPVLRLDSDSLSRRDSFAQQREAIAKGKAPLLVGTQIVAKGHNFPHLSFIGILNADSGLSSADFRAEERLLMLLRQVIGRGTRNPAGCRVLIQTCQTEHPFYKDLLADNLESCWKRLLTERKRAQLPPYAHIAVLRASATTEKHVCNFLDNAVIAARAITSSPVIVYDPVPAPVAKAAGRWRWQLATQSVSRPALHQFLSAWIENLPAAGAVRWHLDIDPAAI
jgi:primosomal protein N' (replication factor Y)